MLLTLAAVLAVSHYEESDPFCASCHTVPEVTYFDRAQQAKASMSVYADLSSAHYGADNGFRCIDCHRGNEGVFHRITALSLGARDTVIWLADRADPAIEKTELVVPFLLTGACVQLPRESAARGRFQQPLPQQAAGRLPGVGSWRQADPPGGSA